MAVVKSILAHPTPDEWVLIKRSIPQITHLTAIGIGGVANIPVLAGVTGRKIAILEMTGDAIVATNTFTFNTSSDATATGYLCAIQVNSGSPTEFVNKEFVGLLLSGDGLNVSSTNALGAGEGIALHISYVII